VAAQREMRIPFTKAHGAKNDFLLTWHEALPDTAPLAVIAPAICDRNTGVGADGWLIVSGPEQDCDLRIRLLNPDGGEVEMSGNGTRCAAAWALDRGMANGPVIKILTGAGPKSLELRRHDVYEYLLRMDMGVPRFAPEDRETTITVPSGEFSATIVNVGNPQCAIFVPHFDFPWPQVGAEVERHPRFPNRTNVSFVRIIDRHNIDVRFFERGVGVTQSSGTGSTGAMVASVLRGSVASPVSVHTPAGALEIEWDQSIQLLGPAQLICEGFYYFQEK
jgi:diaminopimelate epimerase